MEKRRKLANEITHQHLQSRNMWKKSVSNRQEKNVKLCE